MSLAALALLAQLAAPMRATLPVLAFPERGLDDSAAYQGYQTRLYRDAADNTVQLYLDARAQRVVTLLADAEDESVGFTARAGGRAAALRWGAPGARVSRAGRTRVFDYDLIADDRRIDVGWFLLGSMRVERDLQYAERQRTAFSEAPFALPEIDRLMAALAKLDPAERARHLALLHAGSQEELAGRARWTISELADGPVRGVRVSQPALDGLDTMTLELRIDPRRVVLERSRDSVTLRARDDGTTIPFTVRVVTSGRTLTPLARREIFTAPFLQYVASVRAAGEKSAPSGASSVRARRLERQVRGLELLASREKLMAGLPTYATYFGRDMLMTGLMMRAVWRPEMSEFIIASALRKLSPEGRVSHEEALGGQAVREAAAEYASLVEQSAAEGTSKRTADSLLARAATVLRELRRVRENYHMIDAEFQLPIVVSRWLRDSGVTAARKRAFLLDSTDGREPRVTRLLRELSLVARATAPYATDPRASNLISFAPRDSGRWASQSWRDSNVGYAGGRYAMDVNAIWAPHALESMDRILAALRTLGISTALATADSTLVRYTEDPSAMRRAIDRWDAASSHFVVRLAPDDVRARVSARLAQMPENERAHWRDVVTRTQADRDSLVFLALSLDGSGRPIAVANSDVATRLFLGDDERSSSRPDASSRAAVLRDVRLFVRRYPVGLLVDSVGPVVASDAFAPPSVWRDFERDRYHGPRAVWGRENNLFLLGVMSRLADASTPSSRDSSYRRELTRAVDQVRGAVEASGFHSELWSYELRDGRVVPVRYGSGSDVQLWSTTDLVEGYLRARLGMAERR
ncbi:MAG TPA: hypothetical protein VGP25_14700 [Gemmatimonadaceae bacterium]|nr:hypothetical protein [Gemmatimonadaceae bacterium]